jgi:uncharacterized protein
MIERTTLLSSIRTALNRSRVVALMGPRQSGKRTLAHQFVQPNSVNYFDLEDRASLGRFGQPLTALRGRVAIDEIQRRPEEWERK